VEGTFSAHRGLEIGRVLKRSPEAIWLSGETVPVAGQGLMFSHGKGAKVISAAVSEGGVRVRLLAPFDHAVVPVGARTWINSDDRVTHETRLSVEDRGRMKRIPLAMTVRLTPGEASVVEAVDPEGRLVRIEIAPAMAAIKAATSVADVTEELGALGTTAFKLEGLTLENRGAHIPQKELKQLRRAVVEKMTQARTASTAPAGLPPEAALAWVRASREQVTVAPKLNVVLRNRGQVEDLVAGQAPTPELGIVFLDFEFGKDYAPSVALLREHGFTTGIATTRILKPREYYNLTIIERAAPDAVLVRNLGALQWLQGKGMRLIGDFSLNAANSATVDYLLSKGLESVCASYDLNERQLTALLAQAPRGRVEVTLHQYMPEFHMEHCVFAAFMSTGSSFRDCGKPCEKDEEGQPKDAYGHMHFLKADQECRNTMYRGSAQSAAFLVGRENSPGTWRFEALHERGEALLSKLTAYLGLIGGDTDLAQVVRRVGTSEKYGVTEGQLGHAHAWKDRKKATLDRPVIGGSAW